VVEEREPKDAICVRTYTDFITNDDDLILRHHSISRRVWHFQSAKLK